MSVIATGPDGASCPVPADADDTVDDLRHKVRDGLALPLAPSEYDMRAFDSEGRETVLQDEAPDARLGAFGIVGVGEYVDVQLGLKQIARAVLARQGVEEASACEYLERALRGGGSEEAVKLVMTAEWGHSAGMVGRAAKASGVERLDFRQCTTLRVLPKHFLKDAPALAELHLPASLERIDEHALPQGRIPLLDLQDCPVLKEIGASFMFLAGVRELRLPASVERIGGRFLWGSGIKTLDLRGCTALKDVPSGFLAHARALESLHLPASIERIGADFLCQARGPKVLDLRGCAALKDIGNGFLESNRAAEELHLPASLERIGSSFLANAGVLLLDVRECSAVQWALVSFPPSARVELPPGAKRRAGAAPPEGQKLPVDSALLLKTLQRFGNRRAAPRRCLGNCRMPCACCAA